jgi:hypothetical protein
VAYWHTKQFRDHRFLALIDGPAQRSVLKTLAEYIGHDGTLKMSQTTLARESGESASSVNRALDQAESLKLISRHREGRRKAERIVWHACPPDCGESTHTGKYDTAKPVMSKESTADGFIKPAKKRRAPKPKPAFRVKQSPAETSQTDNTRSETETSQFDENTGVSFTVTTLKDKPSLNREVSISETSQTDNTDHYALLVEAAQHLSKLADTQGHDPVTAETEVLLDMLNDTSPASRALELTALAVKLWGDIPQPFTHDHAEQLNRFAADTLNVNTMRLYRAINHYNNTQPAGKPWRTLSQTFKAGFVADYTRKTVTQPAQVSPVAHSVAETHPREFGRIFAPPPVDELMERLSTLTPKQTPPASLR